MYNLLTKGLNKENTSFNMAQVKVFKLDKFHLKFRKDINRAMNTDYPKLIYFFGNNGEGDIITAIEGILLGKINYAFIHRIR